MFYKQRQTPAGKSQQQPAVMSGTSGMICTPNLAECLNEAKRNVLKADLAKIEAMTLLDNADYMYTLYMYSPIMSTPKLCIQLLCNMYQTKYEDLMNEYPSLNTWLTFVISMIVCGREEQLRETCLPMPTLVPRVISPALRLRSVKGNTISSTAAIANNNRNRHDIIVACIQKLKDRKNHPLLCLEFYKQKTVLFNIGKLIAQCVPAEFAVLYAVITPSAVTNTDKNDQSKNIGSRGTFTRVVIVTTELLSHMQTITTLIASMTGATEKNSEFIVAQKGSIGERDILTGSFTKGPTVIEPSDVDIQFIVLLYFQVKVRNSKTLDIQYFCKSVYTLNRQILLPGIADEEKINSAIDSKRKELLAIMKAYDPTIEEEENEESINDADQN
ncbi:uncharacterized protein LOC143210144 [Lasioglossum baleicum]|uniref:uncharacterized protein LOC143210144 n=1 Tax=Lasioglossum baleicum TaxID=434251 RepID=UPI003FCE59A1